MNFQVKNGKINLIFLKIEQIREIIVLDASNMFLLKTDWSIFGDFTIQF